MTRDRGALYRPETGESVYDQGQGSGDVGSGIEGQISVDPGNAEDGTMSGSNGGSSASLPREEAWPPSQSGRTSGGSEDEITYLEAALHGRLNDWGPLLIAAQRLLVWERPLPSLLTAAAVHGLFWIFSYLTPRPLFLLSLLLLCLLGAQHCKSWLLRICEVHTQTESSSDSETLASAGGSGHHRLLSVPELCHYLAETWLTCLQYIQELLLYKRQNPGKFCAGACSCCAALAVVGHYVPGIMISYIILLSVLLWPLVVYRELIQKMYTALEPVLMKIDYTMKGEDMPRARRKRQGKKEPEDGAEPTAETDSDSETELSAFSPEMDVRITALALSITDSELSDEEASILESGGFSVSRATTPQLSDVSEDLDPPGAGCEDAAAADPADSGEGEGTRSAESPRFPPDPRTPEEPLPALTSPLHFVNSHFNGKSGAGAETQLAALHSPLAPGPSQLTESGADGEEFELLEPGELELLREEAEEPGEHGDVSSPPASPHLQPEDAAH